MEDIINPHKHLVPYCHRCEKSVSVAVSSNTCRHVVNHWRPRPLRSAITPPPSFSATVNPAILSSRDLIQFANPSDHIKQSYFLPVSSNRNAFQEIANRQILSHWHTEYDQQTHPNLYPKRWQASKQRPFISVVPLGSVKIWSHDSSLSSYLNYYLSGCLLRYFFKLSVNVSLNIHHLLNNSYSQCLWITVISLVNSVEWHHYCLTMRWVYFQRAVWLVSS